MRGVIVTNSSDKVSCSGQVSNKTRGSEVHINWSEYTRKTKILICILESYISSNWIKLIFPGKLLQDDAN